MTNTVDTSKEAVERVEKFCAEAERRRNIGAAQDHIIGLGLRDMILYASDLRAILTERDQLRREVEEARDRALEEARHVVQLREHACLDYFRRTGNEAVLYEQFDLARDEIRALKARP